MVRVTTNQSNSYISVRKDTNRCKKRYLYPGKAYEVEIIDYHLKIHPGEILAEEFLAPNNISAYKLAKDIEIPQTRISEIIKGNRRITADTALRFSKYFGNSAKFWLGLQDDVDIEEEIETKGLLLKSIKPLNMNVA